MIVLASFDFVIDFIDYIYFVNFFDIYSNFLADYE